MERCLLLAGRPCVASSSSSYSFTIKMAAHDAAAAVEIEERDA
jgi:hypothetical protein